MSSSSGRPGENCPTLGVDAVSLDRFVDVRTNESELLIYDQESEDAWIQSDMYFARGRMI